MKTYTEMREYDTFVDRFRYLKLGGRVGFETFGHDRWINQKFYDSVEWKQTRNHVIARDLGMDLGASDNPIRGPILVHHMNPIQLRDISDATDNLLDPEYLISVSHTTHNAIHYGDEGLLPQPYVERRPGDTKLW